MKNKLYIQIELLLRLFHNENITLDQLKSSLLFINPHSHPIEVEGYIDWVNYNITGYEQGCLYLLSLKSSGGMLESLVD